MKSKILMLRTDAPVADTDFWKGIHMYKGVGVRFAYFITFFLKSP